MSLHHPTLTHLRAARWPAIYMWPCPFPACLSPLTLAVICFQEPRRLKHRLPPNATLHPRARAIATEVNYSGRRPK